MKALVVSDKEFQTETYRQLALTVHTYLADKKYAIDAVQINRNDLDFCMGCFGCWVKKPGECVINDLMEHINRSTNQSDAVIYLCPVVFGQFSANMKNVMDRWLPNVLPFLTANKDGSTMHPLRYCKNPKRILIGYGDDLTSEDAQLFSDIAKRNGDGEVLIYNGCNEEITTGLDRSGLHAKEEG